MKTEKAGKENEKILLISINETTCSLIKGYLQASGYNVFCVNSITDTHEFILQIHPSLIIYDSYLSENKVYSTLERLGGNIDTAVIPFLLFTSVMNPEQLMRIFELGADGFILRPFKPKQLLQIVKAKINKYMRAKELAVNHFTEDSGYKDDTEAKDISQAILLGSALRKNLVQIRDIEYILALGSYTRVFVNGIGNIVTRKLLKNWEEVLPENNFIKISRSAILNKNFISSIERRNERMLQVKMQNCKEGFTVSQRYRVKVRSKLKDVIQYSR